MKTKQFYILGGLAILSGSFFIYKYFNQKNGK